MSTVRIREKFKLIPKRNPVSGHEWHDHGPTTGYEIVGPTGVCDTARTQASAEKKRDEWQDYYDRMEKNPLNDRVAIKEHAMATGRCKARYVDQLCRVCTDANVTTCPFVPPT